MLVIATTNIKKYEVYNTMKFDVEEIGKMIKINGKE